jgi:DNA-directed RNA polymerase subunit RPC12/RpoP
MANLPRTGPESGAAIGQSGDSRFSRGQTRGGSESQQRPVVRCPSCSSDRLIPLTFGIVSIEDRSELEQRPVAKCAKCGQRTYISAKLHRALSQD